MSRIRVLFHLLAACSATGVVITLVLSASVTGNATDASRILVLVPVAGMTSLSGIWTGALAILEPPALNLTDRRIGHGILVALTVTAPLAMLLVGRVG